MDPAGEHGRPRVFLDLLDIEEHKAHTPAAIRLAEADLAGRLQVGRPGKHLHREQVESRSVMHGRSPRVPSRRDVGQSPSRGAIGR